MLEDAALSEQEWRQRKWKTLQADCNTIDAYSPLCWSRAVIKWHRTRLWWWWRHIIKNAKVLDISEGRMMKKVEMKPLWLALWRWLLSMLGDCCVPSFLAYTPCWWKWLVLKLSHSCVNKNCGKFREIRVAMVLIRIMVWFLQLLLLFLPKGSRTRMRSFYCNICVKFGNKACGNSCLDLQMSIVLRVTGSLHSKKSNFEETEA